MLEAVTVERRESPQVNGQRPVQSRSFRSVFASALRIKVLPNFIIIITGFRFSF